MEANDLTFDSIVVGDTDSFTSVITEDIVNQFATLSGDTNPLHTDSVYAQTTKFGKRIVHGMFLGALYSRFVGMYLPGKHCLYLKQTISFKHPVYIGDTVTISGSVVSKSESTRIIIINIIATVGDRIVTEGDAHVQVLV
jgi:3-hydroxybutyryl-CoA dehydratase